MIRSTKLYFLIGLICGSSLFQICYCCQQMQNTCYSGQLIEQPMSQGYMSVKVETCDLNQNWCSVIYNQQSGASQYSCYNAYEFGLFSGLACGDFGDIRDGGCKSIKKADGSECVICCCKGTQCNSPQVFMNIANQRYLGYYNDVSKINGHITIKLMPFLFISWILLNM